ncbi:MAG: hypothetical protein AAGE84_01985 [Cyanobacteria bacterium P01_G01_bin.39]
MYEYNYTKSENTSPIPIVRISINNLRNNQYLQHDAILDTGSDVTLIPVSIINKLSPPKIGRGKITTKPHGLGGQVIGILPYRIQLGFSDSRRQLASQDRTLIRVKAWSCLDNNLEGFIILGRNFLNRYKITFDGTNSKLIVNCINSQS